MSWRGLDPPSAYAIPEFVRDGGAACADANPELFFPRRGSGGLKVELAKAYCWGCQHRVACLEFAVRTGQWYGVWGGLTEEERQQMRVLAPVGGSGGGRDAPSAQRTRP